MTSFVQLVSSHRALLSPNDLTWPQFGVKTGRPKFDAPSRTALSGAWTFFVLKGTALFPLNKHFFAERYGTFFSKLRKCLPKVMALFSAQEKHLFKSTALFLPTKYF